jgi:hypothetical protein
MPSPHIALIPLIRARTVPPVGESIHPTATESSPQSPREPRRATQPARSRREPELSILPYVVVADYTRSSLSYDAGATGERPLRSLSRRHHGHLQADGERPRPSHRSWPTRSPVPICAAVATTSCCPSSTMLATCCGRVTSRAPISSGPTMPPLGGVLRCLGAWLSREAHHDKVSMAIQRRCASVSASV